MPTPRQYAGAADRQAAYRRRTAEQHRTEWATNGIPPLPGVATVPGYARWRALTSRAHLLLQTVAAEMQQYYGERSESWQESERGEAFLERMQEVQEIQSALDELWS
jgi:hypothetical protein